MSARSTCNLVLRVDAANSAALSRVTIIASAWHEGSRVHYVGPATVSEAAQQQIETILIPIVDEVCALLGIHRQAFQISIANIGVSAQSDRGISVSGYSADLPLFLSLLGAAAQLGDALTSMVATGHVTSLDGGIGPVKSLPEKIKAASDSPTISDLMLPDVAGDVDLERLMPRRASTLRAAVKADPARLRTIPVSTLSQAVNAVWNDEQFLSAALIGGYFGRRVGSPLDIAGQIASRLVSQDEADFYSIINHYWSNAETRKAQSLLEAFARFHTKIGLYPQHLGTRLRNILSALPENMIRTRIQFPIIPLQLISELHSIAGESIDDFDQLVLATQGKVRSKVHLAQESAESTLDFLLEQFSEETMAKTVYVPIDTARTRFTVERLTVENSAELIDVLCRFHLSLSGPDASGESAEEFAIEVTGQAFERDGGFRGALSEAQSGLRGGLRYVLDQITEYLKRSQREKHISFQIKRTMDPLDYDQRLAIVKAFMNRFHEWIPEDIRSEPPERYASDPALLVRPCIERISSFGNQLSRF